MNNRKTDMQFVSDAQLSQARDEIADAWAVEYAREDSPWHAETIRACGIGR